MHGVAEDGGNGIQFAVALQDDLFSSTDTALLNGDGRIFCTEQLAKAHFFHHGLVVAALELRFQCVKLALQFILYPDELVIFALAFGEGEVQLVDFFLGGVVIVPHLSQFGFVAQGEFLNLFLDTAGSKKRAECRQDQGSGEKTFHIRAR